MKSHLFANLDLLAEEGFKRDVQAILTLPSPAMEQLPEYAFKHLAAPTRREADRVCVAAAEVLAVPKTQLERAIDVSRFFMGAFAPKGDAESDLPSSLADDIRDALCLDVEQTETLGRLLGELKRVAEKNVQLILLQRSHSEAALPILRAVSTVVDFRAVFEQPYKYEDDVSGYSPKFMGTVPLGIVELTLKGAHTDEVFFQVTRGTLQILLDHLTALQRQMDVAEKGITK
jgi:hypothetical protein